jgi:hypothetical protein
LHKEGNIVAAHRAGPDSCWSEEDEMDWGALTRFVSEYFQLIVIAILLLGVWGIWAIQITLEKDDKLKGIQRELEAIKDLLKGK